MTGNAKMTAVTERIVIELLFGILVILLGFRF